MRSLLALLMFCATALAQENLINAPSADIVAKGSFFTQGQSNYQPSPALFTHSQSLAYGVGHDLEIDLDGSDVSHSTINIGPGVKWAPYAKGDVQTFVGDLTSFPGKRNLVYFGGALRHGANRYTAGGWNSQNYLTDGNHTGAFVGYERTINSRLQPQCDWYSGAYGNGACALAVAVTKNTTIAPGYQFGNSGIRQGNHSALVQVGVTF